MQYDVFNGDADGILALVQLRLAEPMDSELITGVKRDISLLKQVDVNKASAVTVLDISLEKNTEALQQLLANNTKVFYVDHHRPGTIPQSSNLTSLINTDANVCTSLLINDYLKGRYHRWAIAAAFGDNMKASAIAQCQEHGLKDTLVSGLEALGTYVNYNGYGRTVDDLHFHPAQLFRQLVEFEDPASLIAQKSSVFADLKQGYHQDMDKAKQSKVLFASDHCEVVELDDASWARRVSGVYGNDLANQSPDRAHAVLTHNIDDSFTVSVRAPLNNKHGADEICVQFPTGGGRAGAAGINALPYEQLDKFIELLNEFYKI